MWIYVIINDGIIFSYQSLTKGIQKILTARLASWSTRLLEYYYTMVLVVYPTSY